MQEASCKLQWDLLWVREAEDAFFPWNFNMFSEVMKSPHKARKCKNTRNNSCHVNMYCRNLDQNFVNLSLFWRVAHVSKLVKWWLFSKVRKQFHKLNLNYVQVIGRLTLSSLEHLLNLIILMTKLASGMMRTMFNWVRFTVCNYKPKVTCILSFFSLNS